MNLLVISPAPSSPTNQGNRQRIYGMCKAFREHGAIIHFGYLPREWNGGYDQREQIEMTDQWDFYDTIVPSRNITYAAKGRHHNIDDWWDDAIGRYIRYKCTGTTFDACLVNYAFYSKAFDALPSNVVRILDTHDRLSGRREMLERNSVAPEFFYTTEAEEQIALDRADIVIAITAEEALFFRTITSKPVITLGHIAEAQKQAAGTPIADRVVRVGFIGSSNSVNTGNISNFFRALADLLPQGIPCVEFHIYGKCCSKIDIPVECRPYVFFHGQAEDLGVTYAAIDCVFIPFMFGTGQKIKMIEALSFGKPVIATVSASEGSGSKSFYHQLASHDTVIDAIQRFVGDLGFRARLLNDSEQAFSVYVANIERATRALFAVANSRALHVLIESKTVATTFRGRNRAGIIDAICRVTSMMDVLDGVGNVTNRDIATRALFCGAEEALCELTDKKDESQSAREKIADGATAVVFEGLSEEMCPATAGPRIRFILPNSGLSPCAPHPESIDVYVDCRPSSVRPDECDSLFNITRTPTPEHRSRTFTTFQQVLVLSTDIRSELIIAQIRLFDRELKDRLGSSVLITSVDSQGCRAKWTRDTFVQIRPMETLEQSLRGARDLPRKLPSIALAVGFSQCSASSFHRSLLADCGPLISLTSGRVHPVDGEVIARIAQEAANWTSRFLVAPRWGNTFARRTRASVSAIEGMETQVAKIGRSYRAQIDNRINSVLSNLRLHEG